MKEDIYKLKQCEKETHYSLTEDEGIWTCYTNIKSHWDKLMKQGWEKVKEELYPDGTVMSMTFKAPRKALTIGKAVRPKREYTEEQLKVMSERMKAIRKKK